MYRQTGITGKTIVRCDGTGRNGQKLALHNCELGMGEDIHQVSKHLMLGRPRNPLSVLHPTSKYLHLFVYIQRT
jgi:hypothetical protein